MVRGEVRTLRITLESTETSVLGYVYLTEVAAGQVKRTTEVEPGILVDFDAAGSPLGLELLNASAADEHVMHRLATKLGIPELAGINFAEMCRLAA